jgi:hypothetical protein
MKKLILLFLIVWQTITIYSQEKMAQTARPKFNQVELMKQWTGTWQRNVSKDTIEGWEFMPFGKAMSMTNFQVVNGKRANVGMALAGYDDRDDKIKGFWLSPNADFVTWVGVFTSEKLFKAEAQDTFKPELVWWKSDYETISPSELIIRTFDTKGVKTGERSFKKTKL